MLGIPCGVASQTTKPRQPTLTGTLSNSYRTCVQPGLHRVERLWCSSSRIKFRLIHLAPWNPNPPIRHSPRLSLSPLPTQNPIGETLPLRNQFTPKLSGSTIRATLPSQHVSFASKELDARQQDTSTVYSPPQVSAGRKTAVIIKLWLHRPILGILREA